MLIPSLVEKGIYSGEETCLSSHSGAEHFHFNILQVSLVQSVN